uniref:G_PROTEIN_RECEP_F1_2 domain-containing protein n=1 Tax=Gongylonema pulchrum TaxID=637853 RepID=A0A183E848_9BILA
LSPVISLAELFALTTAWPMCCILVIMQLLGSVSAIALFASMRHRTAQIQMPIILQDITMDRTGAAYHLVLMQFIGTLLVVVSHLLLTRRTGSGLTALARPAASPAPIAAAVFLSSLLNSTNGWNPLVAFALASYDSIGCDFGAIKRHAIFWIGPCLATLFACFLYRLAFARCSHLIFLCIF